MVRSVVMPMMLLATSEAAAVSSPFQTCSAMSSTYKSSECCKAPEKEVQFQVRAFPKKASVLNLGKNMCKDTNPKLANVDCVTKALEQAGGDVSKNAVGTKTTNAKPITSPYWKNQLCPVNVHWHLGAEHRSAGQFDENGKSPRKPAPQQLVHRKQQQQLVASWQARYDTALLATIMTLQIQSSPLNMHGNIAKTCTLVRRMKSTGPIHNWGRVRPLTSTKPSSMMVYSAIMTETESIRESRTFHHMWACNLRHSQS